MTIAVHYIGNKGAKGDKGDPGTTDHAALTHRAYADAGHSGFAPSGDARFPVQSWPSDPGSGLREGCSLEIQDDVPNYSWMRRAIPPAAVASWTWVNQNAGGVVASAGKTNGITWVSCAPRASDNCSMLAIASPNVGIGFRSFAFPVANPAPFFGWRESGSGKLMLVYMRQTATGWQWNLYKWANVTTYNSTYGTWGLVHPTMQTEGYFEFIYTGAGQRVIYYRPWLGAPRLLVLSQAFNDYLTPDQFVFGVNPNAATRPATDFYSAGIFHFDTTV